MKYEYQNIHNYATNKAGDGMSVRPSYRNHLIHV